MPDGGAVIAAVKSRADIAACLASPVATAFVLGGDILSLPGIVSELHGGGKRVFVHMDLAEGIGRDAAGMRFAAKIIRPDGVISTRAALLRFAAAEDLLCIQRMFLVDSASFASGIKQLRAVRPDYVEVLPGLVPKAIARLCDEGICPVIAGGMITGEGDVISALDAGAIAVSTSEKELWRMGAARAANGGNIL